MVKYSHTANGNKNAKRKIVASKRNNLEAVLSPKQRRKTLKIPPQSVFSLNLTLPSPTSDKMLRSVVAVQSSTSSPARISERCAVAGSISFRIDDESHEQYYRARKKVVKEMPDELCEYLSEVFELLVYREIFCDSDEDSKKIAAKERPSDVACDCSSSSVSMLTFKPVWVELDVCKSFTFPQQSR